LTTRQDSLYVTAWQVARPVSDLTFVDALLRTDFAIRRHPSYAGAWPLPRPDFHRLEDACFSGHAFNELEQVAAAPAPIIISLTSTLA